MLNFRIRSIELSFNFIVYVAALELIFFSSANNSVNFVFSTSTAPASCAQRLNAFSCKLFVKRYSMNFL